MADLVGLYIRVSTEGQAETGYSLDAQKERLVAFCVAKGWNHYDFYMDPGASGSNLERPGMQRLIGDVEAGRLGRVVVYKLDRLSRSQKDTLYLIEDVFLPHGVDVVSLHENLDTSSPYGRAMIGILSAFAQLERENIFIRTRMGMLERVKQGYWMGGGGTPFGYDYDDKQGILVPNGDSHKVPKIFDLYLAGFSPGKIAEILGLKRDNNVVNILTRRTYLGFIPYKGQEFLGRHQPLVEQTVFELVQEKLASRGLGRRGSGEHLLSGLVWCGQCGARMRYIRWGDKGYKLRCYGQDSSKGYMARKIGCDQPAVWAEELEEAVIQDLFQVSVKLDGKSWGETLGYTDLLAEISREIGVKEKGLKRLYSLFAQGEDDALLQAIGELKGEVAALEEKYRGEEEHRASTKALEQVREKIGSVASSWSHLDGAERRELLGDCLDRIVITGEKAEIYYVFQQGTDCS